MKSSTSPAHLISTLFHVGYLPVAPGTVGSILALIFYYLFLTSLDPIFIIFIVLVVFIVGTIASSYVEMIDGEEDPGYIIIDEVIGMWISLIGLPTRVSLFLLAFILFRFFDIFKPFPIRESQEVGYGIGVMLDDVIAGIYTLIIVQIITRVML